MKLASATADTMLDALKALSNGGTLKIYSGTIPADPDTALSGNTLLATFTFNTTAFGADSTSGSFRQAAASFVATTVVAAAGAPTQATFARLFKSDGTTPVADLTVGTSGKDVNLNSDMISAGGNVTLTSFLEKMPFH